MISVVNLRWWGARVYKAFRWAVKALILALVFVGSMVGLYLLGWDVGERRTTIWLLAIPVIVALLALNLLWPDMRARVTRLLASNQDWDAAEILKRMSKRSDPWAQTQLAAMYISDRGVDRDLAEAARLLEVAANKGYAPAIKARETLRIQAQAASA